MAITYLSGNRILDQQYGAVAPTVPSSYFLALSTTTPTISGTNFTEPTTVSTAYARVEIVNNKTTWGNAESASLSNAIEILFPESTLAWGTITYVGLYDSGTVGAGNLLYFGELTPSRIIQTGTIISFGIGEIVVSIVNV
jgi:hypothetical protein